MTTADGRPAARGDAAPRPVVLFLCDQMQYRRLGLVDPISRTPELDRLAAEGITFDRFYCSYAQCSPSRASLQTGLYPHEAGVMVIYGFGGHTGHLGPRHRTLGQAFAASGYRTAYFGKSHFGYPLADLGYAEGAEHGYGASLAKVDEAIVDDAIALVQEHDPSQPLFLTVSLHEPHPPFETVEPYATEFPTDRMPVPESFDDDLSDRPAFLSARKAHGEGGYRDRDHLRQELAQYYSMISQVDAQFGRVRAALEAKGLWDDAVVAFTSDHGDMMGGHGLRLKGTFPYEELYRVPLLIKAPDVEPASRTDGLAVNVALPATLMTLAGLDTPPGWPDRTLAGMVAGTDPGPDRVFMEHYGAYWGWHPFRTVVTRRYKYVDYYGSDAPAAELYDLIEDPGERTNLTGRPNLGTVEADLRDSVREWWSATGGRAYSYYESVEFKDIDARTLVNDSYLWANT